MELERVSHNRNSNRSSRSHLPVVAVVGYTNAGKSALINKLAGASRESKNQLFTSLDSQSHVVVLPSGKKAVLIDTVGFISELPNILATAFKSTLEEALDADIILHVRDISISHSEFQKMSVLKILRELKCDKELLNEKYIEVCNKTDLLSNPASMLQSEADEGDVPDDKIFISATRGTNCDKILHKIDELLMDFLPKD